MKISSLLAAAWLILGILLRTGRAVAQDNPYKIDNTLFAMYARALRSTKDAKCIAIADSMFSRAAEMHDAKAQCMALAIKVIHYIDTDDKENLHKTVEHMKAFSKGVKMMPYYYYATGNYINYLSSRNPPEALEYANMLHREAEQQGDNYGIYSALRTMGNIYFARRDFYTARRRYLEDIEYGNTYVKDENQATLYVRVALCCIELEQFKEAERYANIGLKLSTDQNSREFNQLILCICKFYTSSNEEFLKYYEQLKGTFTYRNIATKSIVQWLNSLIYIANKDYEKALSAIGSKDQDPYLPSLIYEKMGNYEKALEYREKMHYRNYIFRKRIRSKDIAAQEAQLAEFVLQENSRQAQLENTLLANANAALDLERVQTELVANNASRHHDSLDYINNTLKTVRLKTEIEKKRIAITKAEKENHDANVRLGILVISIVILMLITVSFVIFRSRAARRQKLINDTLKAQHHSLAEARKRAEDADNVKTRFVQNMSHEIRTPLNAIVGFSQLLAERDLDITDEEKADYASRIEMNSELVEHIINDILDLTSIESGHYKMKLEPTPVNEMCREAIDGNRHTSPQGVEMRFTTDLPDGFTAITDRLRTVQVLMNMLSNAMKNTEAGYVELHCTTLAKPEMLTFTVTDTGVGVPAEMAEKIFDRFFKLREFVQGVGLGLTICRTIAQHLGGSIYLDTTHTPGARFVFEFPLHAGDAQDRQ